MDLRPATIEQRGRALAAKLSLPHQGFVLSRPRLQALVEPVLKTGGVVVAVAGPGCGKTGLIVDLLTSAGDRTAYYAVDEDDRDPLRFLSYLMSGLGLEPECRKAAQPDDWAGPQPSVDALDLAAEFAQKMALMGAGRSMLAIEDLHLIDGSATAMSALELVLRALPPEWIVVLSSRRKLPFRLDGVRLGGRLVEISSRELRLTPTEVTAWAKQNWGVALQPSEARGLWQLTEGWPAGLSLLGQHLQSLALPARRKDVVRAITRGHDLRGYLERDVFSSLDALSRDVIMGAALLPRVMFPRDESFLPGERGQAEEILNDLVSRGFLVSRTGGRIFTIHPLVRAFAERRAQRAKDLAELAGRAAQHLERSGELREAASLYLRLGLPGEASRPIRSLVVSSLNAAVQFTHDDWLDTLSENVSHKEPWLLVARARILQRRRAYLEAESLYCRAAGLLNNGEGKSGLLPALLGSAFCLFNLGRWEESLAVLMRCEMLARSPSERAEVLAASGNVLLSLCRWDEAVARWEAALAIVPDEQRRPIEARVCSYRSRLFFLRGDYGLSKIWADRALEMSQGGLGLVHAIVLNGASVTRLFTGEYESAQRYADATLRLVHTRGYALLEMSALLNQAAVCLARWQYRPALLKIKEAEQLGRKAGDAEEIVWAQDMLGDLCRRNKNPQQAIQHHSIAHEILGDNGLSVFERARAIGAVGMDLVVAERFSEARPMLEEAVRISRRWNLTGSLAPALFYLGWLHANAGGEQQASRMLAEAMKLASQNEHIHFFSQEARVATPILALCDRLGAGTFARHRIVPLLPSRLQAYFFELADGSVYPTDVRLGPPRKGRLTLGLPAATQESEVDEAVLRRIEELTDREKEVLKMVALGLPNKVIGSKLFITEKTVKTHTNHIFRKLGVSSRLQATLALQGYQRARLRPKKGRSDKRGSG